MPEPTAPKPKPPLAVKIFAGIKLLKGVGMSGISLGLFRLAHRDLDEEVRKFIVFLRVSPENHYARLLLEKAGLIHDGQMLRAGIATSIYASILLLEGLGLWFGASWAEYLVVVSTGLFVPEEIMACLHKFNWTKFSILVVNAAILVYFIHVVYVKHVHKKAAETPAPATGR